MIDDDPDYQAMARADEDRGGMVVAALAFASLCLTVAALLAWMVA